MTMTTTIPPAFATPPPPLNPAYVGGDYYTSQTQQHEQQQQQQQQLVPVYGQTNQAYGNYHTSGSYSSGYPTSSSSTSPPAAASYDPYASIGSATASATSAVPPPAAVSSSSYTTTQSYANQSVYSNGSGSSSSDNNGYGGYNNSNILPGAPAPRPTHDDLLFAGFGDPAPATTTTTTATAIPPYEAMSMSTFQPSQQQQLQQQQQHDGSDVYVDNTLAETIAQQERLWKEIQERNRNNKSGGGTVTISSTNNNHSSSSTGAMTVYQIPEDKLVPVPQSRNPSGSDAVHPNRKQMKQDRKGKIAASATGGAIVGGILFGPAWPLGVVVGGAAGAVCSKQLCKAGERRAQRKYEQKNFQQFAVKQSPVVKGEAAFA